MLPSVLLVAMILMVPSVLLVAMKLMVLFLPVDQIALRAQLRLAYQVLLRPCSSSPPFAAVST